MNQLTYNILITVHSMTIGFLFLHTHTPDWSPLLATAALPHSATL